MSMRDLISGEAELGSEEEDDQSFDEETGEPRQKKGHVDVDMDDSSEEEEDDDDAEAARAVCSNNWSSHVSSKRQLLIIFSGQGRLHHRR